MSKSERKRRRAFPDGVIRGTSPKERPSTASWLQALLALLADSELEALIGELRQRANEGTLTPGMDAEYKDFVEAVDPISIMQAKARRQHLYCRMPRQATHPIAVHSNLSFQGATEVQTIPEAVCQKRGARVGCELSR